MIQSILAYIIIISAFVYTFYNIVKIVKSVVFKEEKVASNCASGCTGCSVKPVAKKY